MPPTKPTHSPRSGKTKKSAVVSRAGRHPCPVCGEHTKGCSVTEDGLHFCRGEPVQGSAWKRLGERDGFGLYRGVGDNRTGPRGSDATPAPPQDWGAVANDFVTTLTSKRKYHLAEALQLPPTAFDTFPLIGYDKSRHRFTIPEVDASGKIIGISWRDSDGKKGVLAGGNRGVILPTDWRERDDTIYIDEGASDTIGMTAAGLCAIGVPSAGACAEVVVELLRSVPGQNVVVVGDNDNAGRTGAKKLADQLSKELNRPIAAVATPGGYKDVRAWLIAPERSEMSWEERGRELAGLLVSESAEPVKIVSGSIRIESLAHLEAKPTRWLVPNRIPRGKLVLIAGDGGSGKSTLTRHIVAKLTIGQPALGVKYKPDSPGDAILLAGEDGYEDVVIPSLLAEDADLNRVYRIPYVVEPGTTSQVPFGLGHIELLKAELLQRPDTRVVVIDPIASFIGEAKIDDNRQGELRRVLDPLSRLAEETGVTVIIIAHLNKGAGEKAVHRVAGSASYTNTVRLAFLLTDDPQDEDRRLLIPVKQNLPGVDRNAIVFRRESLTDQETGELKSRPQFKNLSPDDFAAIAQHMARLAFDTPRHVNPDAAMKPARAEKKTKVERCADWLRELHMEYAYPSKEIEATAKNAGFNSDNLTDARRLIPGLQTSNAGYQGEWWWGIGEPANWKHRPEPTPTSPDTPNSPKTPKSPNYANPKESSKSGDSGESGNSGASGVDGKQPNPKKVSPGEWIRKRIPKAGSD